MAKAVKTEDPNAGDETAMVVEQTGYMEPRVPTPQEIADACDDPVLLLEAVVILANSDRFRRNNALMGIARHYQADQASVREWQERLDARAAARAEAAAAAE